MKEENRPGEEMPACHALLVKEKTGRLSDGLWISRVHRAVGTMEASVGYLSCQKLISPMISDKFVNRGRQKWKRKRKRDVEKR